MDQKGNRQKLILVTFYMSRYNRNPFPRFKRHFLDSATPTTTFYYIWCVQRWRPPALQGWESPPGPDPSLKAPRLIKSWSGRTRPGPGPSREPMSQSGLVKVLSSGVATSSSFTIWIELNLFCVLAVFQLRSQSSPFSVAKLFYWSRIVVALTKAQFLLAFWSSALRSSVREGSVTTHS